MFSHTYEIVDINIFVIVGHEPGMDPVRRRDGVGTECGGRIREESAADRVYAVVRAGGVKNHNNSFYKKTSDFYEFVNQITQTF